MIREPSPQELDRLVRLYESARERFRDDPDKAAKLTGVCETNPYLDVASDVSAGALTADVAATDLPVGERDAAGDRSEARVELAAWSLVANVLLNLDELFLKR